MYIFENKVGLTANGIFLYVDQPTLLNYRTIICIFDEALNLISRHLLECHRPHDKLNFERSFVFTHFEKIFPVLLFFLLILYRFYGFLCRYSPNIKEFKVLEKKKVRRAKLYYLRDRMNALKKWSASFFLWLELSFLQLLWFILSTLNSFWWNPNFRINVRVVLSAA